MNVIKDLNPVSLLAISLMTGLLAGGLPQQAQAAQTPRPATDIVVEAVHAELIANQNDHSRWPYRDEQKQQDDSISIVVQTDNGAVRRLIAKYGRPLTPAEAQAESSRIDTFIHDPAQLAKQHRDGAQDGKSARDLLNMLPTAFLWRVESENADTIHLHFEPNPDFDPPSLQARVLGTM